MHAHVHVHACLSLSFSFGENIVVFLFHSCVLTYLFFCLSTFTSMHDTCQHTHTLSHAEVTRKSLSCGGDECDADSLSLLTQSYTKKIRTCVYVYHIILFVCFLGTHDNCYPDSLCLLDTGALNCPATSCRPCHPTFLPGLHHWSECACFTWLFMYSLEGTMLYNHQDTRCTCMDRPTDIVDGLAK